MHDDRCSHPSPEVALHQCRADIERVGWHCMGVLDDLANGEPPFAYTIGLTATFRDPSPHPELVVVGLDPRQGHTLLAAAVCGMRDGLAIGDGDLVQGVIAGYPARFRALDLAACSLSFGMSDAYYDCPAPRLQLLWPDPEGLFPGERGCDEDMAQMQMFGGWS